nr:LLM class flavin-dependent oxidoreductase [Kineococcus aurantiacus]
MFSHLQAVPDSHSYTDELELFITAEHLGFDTAWVRQFHLREASGPHTSGGLPSPFVLLAALATCTTRLHLGTAAVTLPLENPVRVAEDAAVLDRLSGGRVELGVANGGGAPGLLELFAHDGDPVPGGADVEAAKDRYGQLLTRLLHALDGHALTTRGQRLNPPAPGLGDRVWEAVLTARSAAEAARRGHGILVGTTQTVPAEVTAAAYHEALPAGVVPRVAVSTAIHPARSREEALRKAAPGIEAKYAWGASFLGEATTLAQKAARLNLHHGTAQDIAASLLASPWLEHATQLNVQVELGPADFGARAEALALFAEQVAPHVGWTAPSADPPTGPPGAQVADPGARRADLVGTRA